MPTERYAKGKGWMSGKRDVKRMKCLGLLGLLCWNQRSAGEPRHAVCLAARPAPSGRVFPAVLQERALLETSPARCCACSTCSQTMQMQKALARWWERHRIVSGAGLEDGIYMWWCVFVNNQFRMLEAGQVEEPDDLFDVFGQQLQGIGKMLMCLDKMRGGQYTTRIWCIFEVFVACQRSIPTTVILPELEVGAIASLEELTHECRVDAEQAKASVQADADAIKDHIKQKHQSFEYVNRTVEHALWCEVIEFLESSKKGGAGRPSQLGPGSTSTGPPTSGPAESTMSESMATDMAAEHGKCNLQ